VVYANTLLHDVEQNMQSALGEFGLSEVNNKANSILRMLASAPANIAVLWTALAGDFKNKAEFQEVLVKLKGSHRIDAEPTTGKFYLVPARKSPTFPHHEPSLLDYRGAK
jgi:hypothetical protein